MTRLEAILDAVGHADEVSPLEIDVQCGTVTRVNPSWARVHDLPHPVYMTRYAAVRCPVGDVLHAAGTVYRSADPDYRDRVGFDVPSGTKAPYVGFVIETRVDPIDGEYHLVRLALEGDR